MDKPFAKTLSAFLVKRSTPIGMVVVTLMTLLIAGMFYGQGLYVGTARKMVSHSYEVREQIQSIYAKVKDFEAAQRGYLITGNPYFLELFKNITTTEGQMDASKNWSMENGSLAREIQTLRGLIADNKRQNANLDSLESLIHQRVDYSNYVIQLYADKGPEAMRVEANTLRGQKLTEHIHAVILDMLSEEYRLFLQRESAEKNRTRLNKILMGGGIVVFYFGWLVMVWLMGTYRRDRQRAESKLVEHDILLQAIMDGGNHAIFATDKRGTITSFNHAAERLLGYPASYFVGKKASSLMAEVYDRTQLQRRAQRLSQKFGRPVTGIEIFLLPLEGEGIFEQEWTVYHRDGKQIPVSLTVTILRDKSGLTHGYLGIAQDISDRKEVEKAKNEFISTVSHELRTPLTSIRGALGLVAGGAMGPVPDKAGELVAIAYKNSERLVLIINDILDIEKIESGKMQMHVKPVHVRQLLNQTLEANAPYGEKFGVRFVVKSVSENSWVLADPDRLMQILANLLSNAAKFSPQDAEVWIDAESREGRIHFSVRDFGPGIPGAFRSRIFEKFAQADHSDTRRYEGTGLGLSITRKLVEAMQGSIGFDTEIAEGTTFYFDLPVAEEAQTKILEDADGVYNGAPPILICEDDKDVALLLQILLRRSGYDSDVVHTIADARQKLSRHSYSAITLDLEFPDGRGVDFLKELRENAATRELPVVVVSATAEDNKRALNGDAIGVIDWIDKPIEETRLVLALQHAVFSMGRESPRILHVEDDMDLVHIIGRSLQGRAELIVAATIRDAEVQLKARHFDLVVLDLTLPDGSGLELLERLNSLTGYPLPVLILSASEPDRDVRDKVEAALVKSRMSETRIVDTILALVQRHPKSKETT